jgi:hypothetical protein
MRARAGRAALLTVVAVAAAVAGCAGRRLDNGVYHSEHGYRVTVPGDGWTVGNASPAELELRRTDGRRAGMLAAATCQGGTARRRHADLERQLLLGLRDRETLEEAEASLAGRRGVHLVVEGRMRDSNERVRIESYTLKDGRCVIDLLYVAPPDAFESSRPDFGRFVDSFATER